MAQPPSLTDTAPAETTADLAYGRRLLEDVRDNVFSFDDPAFYWFCRYAKDHANPASFTISESENAVPWKFLMERPTDYRGQLVVVEGILLSRPTFKVAGLGREGIGRLHQCELSEVGTRALCAVITIEDPAHIPIRSRVCAKGYFIKVRGYQANTGEVGAGPLLVARRIELVQPPPSGLRSLTSERLGSPAWIIAGTALLAVVWLILRRGVRKAAPTRAKLSSHAAEPSPSDKDFDWLTEIPPDGESDGSPDNRASRAD